jgi:hypothetical protein
MSLQDLDASYHLDLVKLLNRPPRQATISQALAATSMVC